MGFSPPLRHDMSRVCWQSPSSFLPNTQNTSILLRLLCQLICKGTQAKPIYTRDMLDTRAGVLDNHLQCSTSRPWCIVQWALSEAQTISIIYSYFSLLITTEGYFRQNWSECGKVATSEKQVVVSAKGKRLLTLLCCKGRLTRSSWWGAKERFLHSNIRCEAPPFIFVPLTPGSLSRLCTHEHPHEIGSILNGDRSSRTVIHKYGGVLSSLHMQNRRRERNLTGMPSVKRRVNCSRSRARLNMGIPPQRDQSCKILRLQEMGFFTAMLCLCLERAWWWKRENCSRGQSSQALSSLLTHMILCASVSLLWDGDH